MAEQLVNTCTIITKTLPIIGEPVSRYDALKDNLLPHLNFGYLRWCDEYKHPSVWEQILLDSSCQFDPSLLNEQIKDDGVRKIALYKDGSTDVNGLVQEKGYEFFYVDGMVVVPAATASSYVWVWYYYRPAPLMLAESAADTSESAIPSLMPAAYRESLKFFVAALYYRTERNQPERSRYWEERFIEAVGGIKPQENPQENRFKNKYPAQPW